MALFGLKTLRRLGKKLAQSTGLTRKQDTRRSNNSSHRKQRGGQPVSALRQPGNKNNALSTKPAISLPIPLITNETTSQPTTNSKSDDSDVYASVVPRRGGNGGTLLRRNKSIVRRAAEERINAWYEQLLEQYPHVNEWKIAYDEIQFVSTAAAGQVTGPPLRRNQHGALYRAKWHGDVVVYRHENLTNVDFFLGLVQLLDRLRHDGLTLYLGACIDAPDKLAIVFDATSIITLEDLISNKISMPRDRSFAALWRQALQLSEAMEYLHCKGVVMGSNLAASNVLIDANGRAKLSLLDFGSLCSCTGRGGPPTHRTTTVFARLPPEVLGSVCESHTEYMRNAWSRGADVYAFGCLLYEIFTSEQLMYSPTSVIGQSMIEMTPNNVMPRSIRQLILACCAQDPADRPSFELIVGALLNAQPAARLCADVPKQQQFSISSPSSSSASSSDSGAFFSARCASVPNLADTYGVPSSENGEVAVAFNMQRSYQLQPMSQSLPTSPRTPIAPPLRTTPYQPHIAGSRPPLQCWQKPAPI